VCQFGESSVKESTSLVAPALGHAASIEHEVLSVELGQAMAQGKPCLAGSDDQGLDMLGHGIQDNTGRRSTTGSAA
jgi:hypothetical protein